MNAEIGRLLLISVADKRDFKAGSMKMLVGKRQLRHETQYRKWGKEKMEKKKERKKNENEKK